MVDGKHGSFQMCLNLSEKLWEQSLELLAKLIQAHPLYASEGLWKAQEILREYLEKSLWTHVHVDEFMDSDICGLDGYVDVAAFGDAYRDYAKVPKRNIIGIVDSGVPGPAIILNGHVDVDGVSAPSAWKHPQGWQSGIIENGSIYGRGSTDMLSGLVALTAVCQMFHLRAGWKGKLILKKR
jgi:acetylornithine deacetylase/succinyl-diaminopimelate desuccinylase-like protein